MVPGFLFGLWGCASEAWDASYVQTVVPWLRDADGGWWLLDTGTPRTLVREDGGFAEASRPNLDIAGLRPGDRPLVITEDLPDRLLEAEARGEITGLAGVVGADLLGEQPFVLDPLAGLVHFGRSDELAGTDPPTEVPVEVVGGGSTCLSGGCYTFGETRMLVDITVDGVELTAMLDTAATYLTVTSSTAARLGDPPTLAVDEGFGPITVAEVVVGLGDLGVSHVPMLLEDDMGPSLARLRVETGRPVEALLGHTVLLRFATEVDLRRERLVLHRYTAPVDDPTLISPGFLVAAPADGCFEVTSVMVGSPAEAAGIGPGSCVEAMGALGVTDPVPPDWDGYFDELGVGTAIEVRGHGERGTFDVALEIERWFPP